jgi:hypothetical protein
VFPACPNEYAQTRIIVEFANIGVIVIDIPVTSTKLVLLVVLDVESVARTTCNTFPPSRPSIWFARAKLTPG